MNPTGSESAHRLMRNPHDERVAHWLLGALIVALLGWEIAWLWLHQAPPPWDQAAYLDTSVIFYRTLREGGLGAFREVYHRALGGMRALLIAVLPVPV